MYNKIIIKDNNIINKIKNNYLSTKDLIEYLQKYHDFKTLNKSNDEISLSDYNIISAYVDITTKEFYYKTL